MKLGLKAEHHFLLQKHKVSKTFLVDYRLAQAIPCNQPLNTELLPVLFLFVKCDTNKCYL